MLRAQAIPKILYLKNVCYQFMINLGMLNTIFKKIIQIDTRHEVWEFENTFGLGSHCEGFVPGMIVAFKPNNEKGIIIDK